MRRLGEHGEVNSPLQRLQALAYGEDVSFGVFEPGGFCAAGGGDAVGRVYAGHVVVFEFYAARF